MVGQSRNPRQECMLSSCIPETSGQLPFPPSQVQDTFYHTQDSAPHLDSSDLTRLFKWNRASCLFESVFSTQLAGDSLGFTQLAGDSLNSTQLAEDNLDVTQLERDSLSSTQLAGDNLGP